VGNELRDGELAQLINTLPSARFACLADYANSRGASDMGLLPDLLPGYQPLSGSALASEYNAPAAPGFDMLAMFDAANAGDLAALYVVGSNPVSRYGVTAEALENTFLIVQDLFLTETAAIADVVLPAAMLYEKSGTVTNSYGDVQLVSKAGDKAGTRTDFELIVRLADKMGHPVKTLVPFGRGLRADVGQSRGAQSGEADRHAVWLTANHLEPKLSPFDPFAILDEIQRLVPGYDISRPNLLAGNSEHSKLTTSGQGASHKPESIMPAQDSLFTSGTLGRYSRTLKSVMESHEVKPAEVAAD
jgi:NADH-quinone oxidoreductase subunit G